MPLAFRFFRAVNLRNNRGFHVSGRFGDGTPVEVPDVRNSAIAKYRAHLDRKWRRERANHLVFRCVQTELPRCRNFYTLLQNFKRYPNRLFTNPRTFRITSSELCARPLPQPQGFLTLLSKYLEKVSKYFFGLLQCFTLPTYAAHSELVLR